jgi:predicted alpha/beta superfamily hydrolase
VCLPNTRIVDLDGPDGAVWRLSIHIPPGDAPDGGWPLLAMTDGNAVIATAVDALRVQSAYPLGTDVQPGIIVAIGYPCEEAYDPLRRSFDLSPPPGRSYPPFAEGGPAVLTGGADRFLRFIEEVALPFVGSLAPVDPARRCLFGHSFGGLFALHVLFSGSQAFSRFVAASPTVYWEDGLLLESERRFAGAARDWAFEVHLSAGEHEGEALAPFQYGRDDTEKRLDHARTIQTLALTQAMAARLGDLPRSRVAYETYPGETHMTMLPIAVSRAVRVAFRISA